MSAGIVAGFIRLAINILVVYRCLSQALVAFRDHDQACAAVHAEADVALYGSRPLNSSSHNRHRYNPHSSCRRPARNDPHKNTADARTVWGKTRAPRKRPVWGKNDAPRSHSPV